MTWNDLCDDQGSHFWQPVDMSKLWFLSAVLVISSKKYVNDGEGGAFVLQVFAIFLLFKI